jgi:hypothetical protein
MAKLKELGGRIGAEEKAKILEDFQATLLDFCESVIYNGSRRGDEWDCSNIFNSERTEGDQGSCSVNLTSGAFYDHNPDAVPQSGGAYDLFCAIFGLKGVKGWRAMRKWNEDRTLPDGSKGVATGRKVELHEGTTIEAMDEFEAEQIKWIQTYQNWTAWFQKHGVPYKDMAALGHTIWMGNQKVQDIDETVFIAEEKEKNDNLIALAVSKIFTRRWLWASEFTSSAEVRERFASELADYRRLSKEVFFWLIDTGNIVNIYERKEIKQAPTMTEEGIEEQPPPKVLEFFNVAFPVYREVKPDEPIAHWDAAKPILFYGMHIPWTDKEGHKHWKYNPKGCPAEPYIIGDPRAADLVVIAESTWDIIAYIDLRGLWHETGWAAISFGPD